MKRIRKILLTVFSFVFVLALGLSFAVSGNKKVSAATEVEVNITYACIEYNKNPQTFTFVADFSDANTAYSTYVYFDGQKMPATVKDGSCIYVDFSLFDCKIGDTILFEIPAGTYYQTDKVFKNDVKMLLNYAQDYAEGKQGILYNTTIGENNAKIISSTPYSIELHKVSWAMRACANGALYVTLPEDDNAHIPSGISVDWQAGWAEYKPMGEALTLNGNAVEFKIQKVYADDGEHKQSAYIQLSGVAKAGDVLTFDGCFKNDNYGIFKVEKTSFVYDGASWAEVNAGIFKFEASTITDSKPQNGFYLSMAPNHIPVSAESGGWGYQTSPVTINGYYKSSVGTAQNANKAVGVVLRKYSATDWYVAFNEGARDSNGEGITIGTLVTEGERTYGTANSGDVLTIGGWYECQGSYIYLEKQSFSFDGSKWTEVTPTIEISAPGSMYEDYLVVAPGLDSSEITATASNGNQVTINFGDAVKGGKFVLREGESISEYIAYFSVSDENGTVYTKRMTVRVCFEDFVMEEGAAVRVANDAVNGLRFSAEMSATTYENLSAQGATFGIVIVPRDYITDGYDLTSSNLFGVQAKYSANATVGVSQAVRRMLLIDNLTPRDFDDDGKYEIRGAITEILSSNLTREFVGVAYVCVNGEYIVASYYANDIENNARSIYYVSQRAIEEGDKNASKVQTKYIDGYATYLEEAGKTYNVTYTVRYIKTRKGTVEVEEETHTAPLNEIVTVEAKDYSSDNYALTTGVSSVTTVLYANKENVIEFRYKDVSLPDLDKTAWHHPKLDATNNYDNATNEAIAKTMAEAGFTSVMLNGHNDVGDIYLSSEANIEVMKNIINMFWKYGGIKTYVSGKNSGSNAEFVALEDYKALQTHMETLSECEGFGGFFAWDEPTPTTAAMTRLAEYAEFFDGLYGNDALFMVNLYPSYYASWSSGDYTSYSDYIKAYCDIVLPKIVNGTKYLSMDSYPVNASGELDQTFMYDLAVLKHYALTYGAQANAILQGCGWTSGDKYEVPTEAEYRMMIYTALAFGMDSVGWWGYSPESENPNVIIPGQTPVNIDGSTNSAYDAIKNVNTEIANFGSLYKTYTWQGVIMSSPSKGWLGIGKDAQYEAFNKVKSEGLLSSYMLSASNTNSFSNISGSGSNYVVGVMKDANNNEAFTVVNYSAPTDNKTLTITFTPEVNGEYVIYTANGSQTVTMTTSGYALTLAPGEGAFIASNDTTHTVTFKNYDGSVNYTTTCKKGETPEYAGETPVHPNGFEFIGWNPTLGPISSDMVYEPIFDEKFTITFKNYNGLVLEEHQLRKGETPVFGGATPVRDGYEFIGWAPEITKVTGDAVYTAQFKENPTVTFVNYDGTFAEKSEKYAKGATVDYKPTLDGYVFNGWTLQDGSEFVNDGIDGDVTLVANWYKIVSEEKSVLSAADLKESVTLEDGYGYKEEDATANPNAGWYFDSDYHGVTGAGNTDENKFENLIKFTLTYDGGAGTDATGRETYLILPAINYKLYSKVDFVYVNNTTCIKALTIYGTEVSQHGGNNKLISIVTDENGTKLYFREINSVEGDVTANAEAVVELPESVANGSEGLRLNITVGGWFKFAVTEFHLTKRAIDYMSEIKGALADIESDSNNTDAFNKYLEFEQYMTEYERANIELSENFINLLDNKLLDAVINAQAGSAEQASAIEDYRDFHNSLTTDEQTETHKINVALVNNVVYKNFYELGAEQILENDPVVDPSNGAQDSGERIQTGWGGHNTDYNTTYETYVHLIQFASGDYDGTVTLPAIDYNSYAESYFGLYAIVSDSNTSGISEGVITINGKSFTFDHTKGHNFKVIISSGVLWMVDDSKNNADGGAVVLNVVLPENVANGTTGLVIDFKFDDWAKAEVTEMRVTPFEYKNTAINAVKSIESSASNYSNVVINGNSKFADSTKYPYTTFSYSNGNTESATFTLNPINFSAYEEVYFGIAHAMTYSEGGSMTIAGQTFNITKLGGYTYRMKATVKNGVLTVTDDGSQSADMVVEPYFIQVALSESVLNGSEGLVIEFATGDSYSWLEVTNMIATKVSQTITTSEITNEPSATGCKQNGATPSDKIGKLDSFVSSYSQSYWTLFRTNENNNFDGVVSFANVNYNDYDEVYFGMYLLLDAESWDPLVHQTAVITINGQSWTITSNPQEYWYKVTVSNGVLTVVTDKDGNLGQKVLEVELSASVLNGTEALSISFNFSAYAEMQTTEMHTANWVDAIA